MQMFRVSFRFSTNCNIDQSTKSWSSASKDFSFNEKSLDALVLLQIQPYAQFVRKVEFVIKLKLWNALQYKF